MGSAIISPAGGLRARKKQQTKRSIAAVAARLFKKRGFENVRMIDIAQVANVSEQTVYNYFPSKEHLVFDLDQEFEARIIGVVVNRSPGTSLAQSLRAAAFAFLDEASRSVGKKAGFSASVIMRPALRRVWVEMNARIADNLANALVENEVYSRARAKILARWMVAIFAVTLEEVAEASLARTKRAALRRTLRPVIESHVTAIMTSKEL